MGLEYPTPEEIAWLKEELGHVDFFRGADAIKTLIDASGIGKATLSEYHRKLTVTTGGWSGCEEILSETNSTIWRMAFWESTHRGGMEVFSDPAAGQ